MRTALRRYYIRHTVSMLRPLCLTCAHTNFYKRVYSQARHPFTEILDLQILFHSRILEECLQRIHDINVRDRDGKTPLMYAASARWRYSEALKLLIARGADVNAVDHSHSRTALQVRE